MLKHEILAFSHQKESTDDVLATNEDHCFSRDAVVVRLVNIRMQKVADPALKVKKLPWIANLTRY